MEGAPKAGGSGKAVLPVPAGIDAGAGAAKSSARAARTRKATAAADAPAVATEAAAAESWGGEEDDDEQVERFYALLANIRALRGAYGAVSSDGAGADGVDAGGVGAGATKKRLRGSEPPWRPAFRLEDFAEQSPASDVAKRSRRLGVDGEGSAAGTGVRVRRLDTGGESV